MYFFFFHIVTFNFLSYRQIFSAPFIILLFHSLISFQFDILKNMKFYYHIFFRYFCVLSSTNFKRFKIDFSLKKDKFTGEEILRKSS